jgi:hypothetical protein
MFEASEKVSKVQRLDRPKKNKDWKPLQKNGRIDEGVAGLKQKQKMKR